MKKKQAKASMVIVFYNTWLVFAYSISKIIFSFYIYIYFVLF